uniref:Uncharacterized protein n=1 Tax=Arundo donax TaxID=35708 RepID=A0A0A9FZ80_ARUDO
MWVKDLKGGPRAGFREERERGLGFEEGLDPVALSRGWGRGGRRGALMAVTARWFSFLSSGRWGCGGGEPRGSREGEEGAGDDLVTAR